MNILCVFQCVKELYFNIFESEIKLEPNKITLIIRPLGKVENRIFILKYFKDGKP